MIPRLEEYEESVRPSDLSPRAVEHIENAVENPADRKKLKSFVARALREAEKKP